MVEIQAAQQAQQLDVQFRGTPVGQQAEKELLAAMEKANQEYANKKMEWYNVMTGATKEVAPAENEELNKKFDDLSSKFDMLLSELGGK